MSLTRRLFSKGAVAAPAVAPGAVREFLARGGGSNVSSLSGVAQNAVQYDLSNPIPSTPGSMLAYWKKEFAEFLANRDDDLGEAMRYVRDLDADLMVNKSLSLTARVRMQAQRELDRNFERRKRAYLGQIKHLAGLA